MKVIDLSLPLQKHWRWKCELSVVHEVSPRVTAIATGSHGYTHMDTPSHHDPNSPNCNIHIEDLPIDATVGEALVIDLSYKGANDAIEPADLEPYADKIKENDIILLKTCWDTKADWTTYDYWDNAPYVSREACLWLKEKPIKAIGFDFPQDYVCRHLRFGQHPDPVDEVTHYILLRSGIYLIEYLCNMSAVTEERIIFAGQPLKVVGAEGAQVRAVAIEGVLK